MPEPFTGQTASLYSHGDDKLNVMLIDTHCHLDDSSLYSRLAEVLRAGKAAGVGKYIVPGVAPEGWERIARIAKAEKGIYPAYGLHPMLAGLFAPPLLERLRSLAGSAVAIGEIGLDYILDVPRDVQQAAFRAQLRLSVEIGLPVLIHCRRAFADLLEILRAEEVQRIGGVMHAFSGSCETARECVHLGLLIGIAGPVTFRNAVRPVEVAKHLPLDHLLLETDSPDLAPESKRGRDNEPAFLVEIARKVAEVKRITVEQVAETTSANAKRLFRLS